MLFSSWPVALAILSILYQYVHQCSEKACCESMVPLLTPVYAPTLLVRKRNILHAAVRKSILR